MDGYSDLLPDKNLNLNFSWLNQTPVMDGEPGWSPDGKGIALIR